MEIKAEYQWKIEVNDRYQKVVATILTLSTASVILPVSFLRDILAIDKGKALIPYLGAPIYWSWAFLGFSILFGILFYYFSAKWVKQAWGIKTLFSTKIIEVILDFAFWLMVVFFILGIYEFVYFIITSEKNV